MINYKISQAEKSYNNLGLLEGLLSDTQSIKEDIKSESLKLDSLLAEIAMVSNSFDTIVEEMCW